jgi:hypothetical protein
LPIYRFSSSRDLAHAYRNAKEELGEQVGTLDLNLCFWPGLSGHHQKLASKNNDLDDIMKVLDCAEEAEGTPQERDGSDQEESGSDSDSGSGSDSDDNDDDNNTKENNGIMGELREQRKKVHGLHRKHRGLMQWKGVRQLVWAHHRAATKVDKLVGKASGKLSKGKDVNGVDTEM